jgi:hypothetical protein
VAIMGDIKDINNPIMLEERKLDLKYRKRLILKKIEIESKKTSKTQVNYEKFVKALKEVEVKV